MCSGSRRYWITFNGEIYNFRALREELGGRGHTFRGHCDTEVVLAALEEWGLTASLSKFNGMFALAVWDAREQRLALARDRIGEKTLYYGFAGEAFVFASELKALRKHPAFDGAIDRDVLALYLRHLYVPSPYCIYRGFHKLEPAEVVVVSRERDGWNVQRGSYWSAKAVTEAGSRCRSSRANEDLVLELDHLLRDAVRLRLESDVPVGALLSGGVDSSTVVALLKEVSTQRPRTFTIGFSEERDDEAIHAKGIAEYLGTEHTEIYVSASDALHVIPRRNVFMPWRSTRRGASPCCSEVPISLETLTTTRHGHGTVRSGEGPHRCLRPRAASRTRLRTTACERRSSSFGGKNPGTLADTWEWDGSTWLPKVTTPNPPARSGHAMAYDRLRHRVVLFGGDHDGTLQDDTWEWRNSSDRLGVFDRSGSR